MSTRQDLLTQIESFLVEADMPASTFGKLAVSDDRLVARLRSGKDVRTGTYDTVLSFIEKQRSKGLKSEVAA